MSWWIFSFLVSTIKTIETLNLPKVWNVVVSQHLDTHYCLLSAETKCTHQLPLPTTVTATVFHQKVSLRIITVLRDISMHDTLTMQCICNRKVKVKFIPNRKQRGPWPKDSFWFVIRMTTFEVNSSCMSRQNTRRAKNCGLCDYASVHTSTLRRHMNTHSGDKTHKSCTCSQCDFASVWQSALSRHLEAHSGEKSYKW